MGWFEYIKSKLPAFNGERLGPNDLPSNIVDELENRDPSFRQERGGRGQDWYSEDRMRERLRHESSIEQEFEAAFHEMDSVFRTFFGNGPMMGDSLGDTLGDTLRNPNFDNFDDRHHSDEGEEISIKNFFRNGPILGSGTILWGFSDENHSGYSNEENTRGFFNGPLFDIRSIFGGFRDDSEDSDIFGNFSEDFSQIDPNKNGQSYDGKSLREKMFDEGSNNQLTSPIPNQKFNSDGFTFQFRSPFLSNDKHSAIKGDQNLDKEIESGKSLDDILLEQKKSAFQSTPSFSSVFKSSSTSKKINPDGSVETTTIRYDSDGNKERVISRRIGEQTHTVTTKENKMGKNEKIENFVNMDQKDLEDFNNNWNKESSWSKPKL